MRKHFILFILGFFIYMGIEVSWRAITEFQSWALKGTTSIWMGVVGGLLLITIGALNDIPIIRKKVNIFYQAWLSAFCILTLEFISGVILNLWLHFDIWDYSNLPGNLLGQICIPFALIWFIFSPTVIWLEDQLKYYFFKDGKPYSLLWLYLQLFKIKNNSFNK